MSPKMAVLFLIFATSLGAVDSGIARVTLGLSISGKEGATTGGVTGAIFGGVASNKLAESTQEFTEELQPKIGLELGAHNKTIELPPHYS
ncbi:hypothetical protein [Trichormus azollae]|uniref:Uncharacterized protein n=1 Tax=Nostoc azollae (strain 0708) TaxID=551115 RepID=D7E5N9_NOSA0|nr:hypothetical protein [Trichormus azollae]ADI66298.1 conserved hypothetical protein ['Nostoc azollae' 0708]